MYLIFVDLIVVHFLNFCLVDFHGAYCVLIG